MWLPACAIAALLGSGGCGDGPAGAHLPGDPVGLVNAVRTSTLEPGPPTTEGVAAGYAENAWTVYAGQRLYAYFNCAGCHAHGGGAIGPPLADAEWLYGSAPEQIFASIWQGRPHGMPAFGQRIGADQAWLLVAYVRSLAGLARPAPLEAAGTPVPP